MEGLEGKNHPVDLYHPHLSILFGPRRLQLIWTIVKTLVALAGGMLGQVLSVCFTQLHQFHQRTAILDSRCISWMLHTSLEKGIRLSALKFLATTPRLAQFTTALVSQSLDILIDCVKVNKGNPVVVQGMEQLGELSAMCLFLTYSHLSAADPMSSVLVSIHQRYREIFPLGLSPGDFPSPHTLGIFHVVIHSTLFETSIDWRGYKLTNHEHATVAHALSKLCWFGTQRELDEVQDQCLRFASHSLTQDPLPPPPIIADCLLIIAILLRCNVPNTMILGERCVHVWQISTLLTKVQCATRGGF